MCHRRLAYFLDGLELTSLLNHTTDHFNFFTDWQVVLGFPPSRHATGVDRGRFHSRRGNLGFSMRRSVAANPSESTAISAEILNVELKSDCGVPITRIIQNPESKIQK